MEAETTHASYEGSEKILLDACGNTDGGAMILVEPFLNRVAICKICKENLYGRQPKFLNCLHSLCNQCLSSLDVTDGHYVKCPECNVVTHLGSLIDNLFEIKPQPTLGNGEEKEVHEKLKFCMGCDDNVVALFFCVECSEWLCDQCTQAHKRVKITKDHTIESKDVALMRSEGSPHSHEKSINPAFMCHIHPHEPLKLYCCTCHKMTCRDCQLVEHKDHKYQFLQEAATSYREVLSSLLLKIKEKQLYIDNAKNLIEKRNKEISQKETIVINEIKAFVMSLISDINHKCKQLIGDLQSICLAKKRQLLQKDAEISCLFESLEYCLLFGDHLLTSVDDMQLLYAYHLVANRLKSILKTRCEVPNPHHVVDLRFSPNLTIAPVGASLGCIAVDGVPFNRNHLSGSSEPIINSSSLPQMNLPGVFSAGNQGPPHQQQQQQQQQQQMQQSLSSPVSISDQKMMNQWLKRQSEERRHHQMQRNQQHQLQQQQQQQQQQLQMLSLFGFGANNNGNMMPADNRHCLMPNQSASISSSNMSKRQQRSISGTFYPPQQLPVQPPMQQNSNNGYIYPPSYGHIHPHHSQSSQQLISLSLLQEERMRRIKQQQHQQQKQQQQQMAMTSTRPIVIEPRNSDHITSPNSIQGLQDLTKLIQNQTTPNSNTEQSRSDIHKYMNEQSIFPAIVKQENQKCNSYQDGASSILNSRSPTPRIESTTFDHTSFDSSIFQSMFENWGAGDDVIMTNNSNSGSNTESKNLQSNSKMSQNEVLMENDMTIDKNLSISSDDSSCLMSSTVRCDPSDDYCAVCASGGELLCCDGCPRVFHLQCHVSEATGMPGDKWFCGMCTSDDVLRLEAPDDDEMMGKKRNHKIDLTPKERLVCERLLMELFCDCESIPFHELVRKSVSNYQEAMTHPTDLKAVRIKLIKDHFDKYQTVESFIKDILLVFTSLSLNPNSEVGRTGKILADKFRKRCYDLLPYVDLKEVEGHCSGIDAKRRKLNGSSCPYMSAEESERTADGGRNTAASI